MHAAIPIAMVFVGCCSNVVFLELLVRDHPGSGNIITFSQFLFIALEGFIFASNFGTKKSKIPLSVYGLMVTMFFIIQVINNYAFSYNIPMTLHIIFRAGSLIASLTLGVIIMHKRYPTTKYVSVAKITLGIGICTYASASYTGDDENADLDTYSLVMGVGMLVFSLFTTARMGLFQEQVYSKHGKHPKESLFYNHALPLPGFLLVAPDIYNHVILFNQSEPVWFLGLMIPKMWLFLIGNVLTQYICIRSVFILTAECSALAVTLVVTLRKFVSLIFSIVYFKNPFTYQHWIGTTLVFAGTLMFTDVLSMIRKQTEKKAAEKKTN